MYYVKRNCISNCVMSMFIDAHKSWFIPSNTHCLRSESPSNYKLYVGCDKRTHCGRTTFLIAICRHFSIRNVVLPQWVFLSHPTMIRTPHICLTRFCDRLVHLSRKTRSQKTKKCEIEITLN